MLRDYFAESPWHEEECFRLLEQMKRERWRSEGFCHFDTPLIVEHETRAQAGFCRVEAFKNWGDTYALYALKREE